MAVVTNPYMKYGETKVNTVSKGSLLLMMYDAAVRFLKEIKLHITNHNFLDKSKSVENFLAIITELESTLNFTANKQLAQNLSSIYNFILREISFINFHNDLEKLEKITSIVENLRSAWQEANRQENSKN